MHKKPSWPWSAFFFIYVFVVLNVTMMFFETNSPPQIYYQVLISFNSFFLIHYLLNILALVLDIIAIIPFYNFIKPESAAVTARYFSTGNWKWVFILRIGLLVAGHAYGYKQLQSLFLDNYVIALIVTATTILPYAPSYFTNFIVAYRQEKH